MKNIFILIFLFIATKSHSQTDFTNRFSLSIESVYSKPFGDNFFNKCYKPNFGRGVEAQVNFSHLFIGVGYKNSSYSIMNKEFIGDFSNANLEVNYLFIGYRHYLKNKKIYFEDRIGFGSNVLTSYSLLSKYIITGNSYFLGSKANYNFNPNLNFYFGIDMISTNYKTEAEEAFKEFYQQSYQFEPKLGLKFSFGSKTK